MRAVKFHSYHLYSYALARGTSLCLLFLIFVVSLLHYANAQSFTAEQVQKLNQNSAQKNNPLTHLDDAFANDIKLLDNRFRLDYEVEEVTMVFFREYGSAPVVLVRPDGSKIFQYKAIGQQVTWFDSPTYDMINI